MRSSLPKIKARKQDWVAHPLWCARVRGFLLMIPSRVLTQPAQSTAFNLSLDKQAVGVVLFS